MKSNFLSIRKSNPDITEWMKNKGMAGNYSMLEQYYEQKNELIRIEDELHKHQKMNRNISFADLDFLLKKLGNPMSKKMIKVCSKTLNFLNL